MVFCKTLSIVSEICLRVYYTFEGGTLQILLISTYDMAQNMLLVEGDTSILQILSPL